MYIYCLAIYIHKENKLPIDEIIDQIAERRKAKRFKRMCLRPYITRLRQNIWN